VLQSQNACSSNQTSSKKTADASKNAITGRLARTSDTGGFGFDGGGFD
jgi:hypothetical protein